MWRNTACPLFNLEELKELYVRVDLLSMNAKEIADELQKIIKKEYGYREEIYEEGRRFVEGFGYKGPPNCS